MTDRQQMIARLLGGEVIFIPRADWMSIQKLGSGRLYADIRKTGKYLHFVQYTDGDIDGLRVWVDEHQGRGGRQQSRVSTMFADARSVGGDGW